MVWLVRLEASKSNSKQGDDQQISPFSSCIPRQDTDFDPKKGVLEILYFPPELRSCSCSAGIPWLGHIYWVLLYRGFFFHLPFKKQIKEEKNTLKLWFIFLFCIFVQFRGSTCIWTSLLGWCTLSKVSSGRRGAAESQGMERHKRQIKSTTRSKKWRKK